MIELPRRSVTRFFIPLIDVLTLLFCIFLLMPFVKSAGAGDAAADAPAPPPPEISETDPRELNRKIDDLRKEIERLHLDRSEVIQRLVVYPMEIGREDGKLYYYSGGERLEVRSADDAARLLEQHRRDLRQKGARDQYYLILFPRVLSGFPTERQVREYERWFSSVPHGFDNPRAQN
jgi:hypothetical protein